MRRAYRLAAAAIIWLSVLATPASALANDLRVTGAHIVVHFSLQAGQQPENIALEPDGSADLTFSGAAQIARVNRRGDVRIIAQLPVSTRGKCPTLMTRSVASAREARTAASGTGKSGDESRMR